jgi:ADP-heptose:LPS heptosyltransferase
LPGEAWPAPALARLIAEAESEEGGRALFGVLAEGLCDRFEPRLVDAYVALFAEVMAAALPEFTAAELRARYERVRRPRPVAGDPHTVYVLSRVTLGADIAIASVLLDAAKRRFPRARIALVGGEKSYALFAADPRIEHAPVAYQRRGTLRERLEACPRLDDPDALVIDPDSRLTQLGLLPVCPEENYVFFESRAYGCETEDSLGTLTRRWAAEVLGVTGAHAYIAPAEQTAPADAAVSLGVGGNSDKGLPDPFERRLLGALADRGLEVLVDCGPGGEEEERVRRAAAAHPERIRLFHGSFAAFASAIARSKLYVGYDSAGQHAAAACGTPLAIVFAGYPNPRFCARWRPTGRGPVEVIPVENRDAESALTRTLDAVERLLAR